MGLMFNIYLIFQLVVSNTYNGAGDSRLKSGSTSGDNQLSIVDSNKGGHISISGIRDKEYLFASSFNSTQDHNRMKSLSRIVGLLITLYILFDLQLVLAIDTCEQSGSVIELSMMDGIQKINKTKIIIELYIQGLALIIIAAQNYYHYNQQNSTFSELYLILLTNILGISALLASNDWQATIISWELFNLSLYLLVSLNSFSESSLSASQKYFLLSALSTAFLLQGVAIIYYTVGSTNYDNISISIAQLIHINDSHIQSTMGTASTSPLFQSAFFNPLGLISIAFMLILITLLFKLSAAPLHNWAPDLYDGLHTNISTWMIIIPKITVLSLLFFLSKDLFLLSNLYDGSLLSHSLNNISTSAQHIGTSNPFELLLLITGTLSLLVGTIALNNQWKVKRFFAYSGVSHVGFILLALYCYDLHSYLIYFIIYGITTFNIFGILLILSQYQGKEIKYITQQTGISGVNPFIGIAFAINQLSLAGI